MQSKVMEKLRKLLRAKEGEAELGNTGAAQSFAAKIQELLIKHKLEFADLETPEEQDEQDRVNPITYRTVYAEDWGEERLEKRIQHTEELGLYIAAHFFCQCLSDLNSNRLLFAGRREDVDICIAVFCRLMRAGLNICEAELATEQLKLGDDELQRMLWTFYNSNAKYRRSFLAGFNYKIKLRLDEERVKIEQTAGDCTALVRMTKEVDNFVKDILCPVDAPPKDFGKSIDRRAYSMGLRHGESVPIRPNAIPE